MGIFYEKVMKMRENGRSLYKTEKPKEAPKKPKAEVKKPVETAVKKHDKGTDNKS